MTDAVLAVEVRQNFYLDSVALMRISREITALPSVVEAALMIGSDANKQLLRDAGLFDHDGDAAGPNDLIISISAIDAHAAADARRLAVDLLDQPRSMAIGESTWRPKSLDAAAKQFAGANLALISVPGEFAAGEANKALDRGLHVMLFSDNVSLADEISLKRRGREAGLLVMGPDCGTALIGGTALGFANAVPAGSIGLVSASGTGLQEVSCLLARHGGGVSHGIGVGGRDLKGEVGGIMTLTAIEALAHDPTTECIVVISKPPDSDVARAMLDVVEQSQKRTVVCLIGAPTMVMPANAVQASTLAEAATAALGRDSNEQISAPSGPHPADPAKRRLVGHFCGGTLCAEAQVVAQQQGLPVSSNAPISGSARWAEGADVGHLLLDLGADEFTVGRPHPMIEPSVRSDMLVDALANPQTGVALVDIVLGYGAHPDPAAQLVDAIGATDGRPPIVASVCGTNEDAQNYDRQVATLEAAGIVVEPSNAAAAARAVDLLRGDQA